MSFSASSVSRQPLVFDDRLKANFGAIALFFLWLVVSAIFAWEEVFLGQHQLLGIGFAIFTMGVFVIIAYFFLLANSEGLNALMELLAKTSRADSAEGEPDARGKEPAGHRRLVDAATNPWVPVTLEFLLVGWLIYSSGGIVNSPYTPVPIGMMIIGQSVYHVRPIAFGRGDKVLDLPKFAAGIALQYGYPLLIMVVLLIGLVLLQADLPLVTKPAPTAEIVFTALFSLFVCMCVTHVTRCADRAGSQSTS